MPSAYRGACDTLTKKRHQNHPLKGGHPNSCAGACPKEVANLPLGGEHGKVHFRDGVAEAGKAFVKNI
jgi:hypothetical protein